MIPSGFATTSTCPDNINRFQCLFNGWVEMVRLDDPNMLDAKHPNYHEETVATWVSVKHEWRQMEKQINRMYGI
jgi:hypothetical protein